MIGLTAEQQELAKKYVMLGAGDNPTKAVPSHFPGGSTAS